MTADHILPPERAVEMMLRFRLFQAVDTQELPGEFYFSHTLGLPIGSKNLPDFFVASAWPIVSARFRDILSSHEIGSTRFHPIKILDLDRETVLPGGWFVLNVVSERECVDLSKSKPSALVHADNSFWMTGHTVRSSDIAVNAIIDGPDLWGDPRVERLFFFGQVKARNREL